MLGQQHPPADDKKAKIKDYLALQKKADSLENQGDPFGAAALRAQATKLRQNFNSKMNTYVEEHYHEPKRKIQENISKLANISREMGQTNEQLKTAYDEARNVIAGTAALASPKPTTLTVQFSVAAASSSADNSATNSPLPPKQDKRHKKCAVM